MKDKPTKWDIKVFVISDAMNNYVHQFQIDTGKQVEISSSLSHVVLDLLSGLENQYFKLFINNYYTSPSPFFTFTTRV